MRGGAVSVLEPEFSIQVWSAGAAAQPLQRVKPSGSRLCQLSGLVGPAGDSETLSESVQGTAPLSATGADHPGCPSCDFHAC